MIIARGDIKETGEQLLLLGLSRVNVSKLMQKQPIVLTRKSHGDGIPEGWQIVIMFGETEDHMAKEISALITTETKIHRDPRL